MRLYFFIFLGAVAALAVFFYFRSENIGDLDSFYHFRHAAIYKDSGILQTDFPWTQYSIIKKFSSDIWYGFHLLLIPFTLFANPVFGLKLSGIFITAIAIFLFYWSIRRLNVLQKFLWPFLLVFASPYITYRLAMIRPHVLSIGLAALLFSYAVSGGFWGIFLTSFAFVFLHIGLFWVPILIFAIVAFVKLLTEKVLEWRKALALILGLFAGSLMRPNPLGAAQIAYAQIIQLFIEKQKGIPLHFGMELLPLPASGLKFFLPFMILWIGAMLIFTLAILRQKRNKDAKISPQSLTILLASGVLSILFFLMTILVAQRSFDFWAVFGVIFIAFAFSYFISARKALAILGLFVFIFMAIYGIYKHGKFSDEFGWNPYTFKSASEWLKNNSNAGEIVFNTSWDYFPELFFWNTKNYYINGMDPIFQYAYDPKLYWKSYYFELGKATKFTCGATTCGPEEVEDTYTVLKNDFKASYVFLSKLGDKNLYDYLLTDPRFLPKYEDTETAVFELK